MRIFRIKTAAGIRFTPEVRHTDDEYFVYASGGLEEARETFCRALARAGVEMPVFTIEEISEADLPKAKLLVDAGVRHGD